MYMLGEPVLGFIVGPEILLIVLVILLLILGPKKIPQLARSGGKATKEWRKGREEVEEELEDMDTESSELNEK